MVEMVHGTAARAWGVISVTCSTLLTKSSKIVHNVSSDYERNSRKIHSTHHHNVVGQGVTENLQGVKLTAQEFYPWRLMHGLKLKAWYLDEYHHRVEIIFGSDKSCTQAVSQFVPTLRPKVKRTEVIRKLKKITISVPYVYLILILGLIRRSVVK